MGPQTPSIHFITMETGTEEGPSSSERSPDVRERREGGSKLFLGGLSWETTEEKLTSHFSKYGEIIEAVCMRDRQTGRPRGFGFVTYVDPGVADRVVQDTHVIDGRQIDAKKSVPQEVKPKARKIFVGGLATETTEQDLKAYFLQFGEVAEAVIMHDHMSGRSRGFGFVTFESDSATEGVFTHGAMHELGGKRVEVKPATPKGIGPQMGRGGERGGGERVPREATEGGRGAGMYGVQYGGYGMYGYPPGMMQQSGYGYSLAPYYMMQQGAGMSPPGVYPASPAVTGAFAAFPSGPFGAARPQGMGGSAAPISMVRQPVPGTPQQRGPPQISPTSPYRPQRTAEPKGGGGASRGKVDSASSLDQHSEQQLSKLSLG